MPRAALALCAVLALALAPAARAGTTQIPGFTCSVTAYTPSASQFAPGGVSGIAGVSCGGSEAGYEKQLDTQLWNLVSGGWVLAYNPGWSGWYTLNPLKISAGLAPCAHGRWYATVAYANVTHSGVESGAEASSENAGWQCP